MSRWCHAMSQTSNNIMWKFMQHHLLYLVQHRYEQIVNWYNDLAKENPDIVKFIESIGKSVEGKDQPAVHITAASSGVKQIYFQCQIHASKVTLARELHTITVSPSPVNYCQ